MAGLGIGFGLLTGSEAIMLDGFFSLIAFVMALLTIRVSTLVAQPDDVHFQFGYATFEPALNTVKGLIILLVSAFAFFGAVQAIVDGGRDLSVGWAIVYAVAAAVGCLALGVNSRRVARRTGSPLLTVDARSWVVDAALSGGVALAFVAAGLLSASRWSHLVPYVDPVLVIALVLVMIGMPLGIIRQGLGELLLAAPDEETQADVRARIDRVAARAELGDVHLRMIRAGRSLYTVAHVLLPGRRDLTVAQLDSIRDEIQAEVEDVPGIVVDTIFTTREFYAPPLIVEEATPAVEGGSPLPAAGDRPESGEDAQS